MASTCFLPLLLLHHREQVDEIVEQTKAKISKLAGMHKKHLLPGFDDRSVDEASIEALTDEITSSFHECQKRIKDIGSRAQTSSYTPQELKMCKNVQTSLGSKVQELLTTFRKSQSDYLKSAYYEKTPQMGGSEAGTSRAKNLFQSAMEDGDDDPDFDIGFTDQQLSQVASNEAAITQREREINEIAKSIFQVAEIFKDMQTLVIDQGTLLDRIDYNIEQVHVHVQGAVKELEEVRKEGHQIPEERPKQNVHAAPHPGHFRAAHRAGASADRNKRVRAVICPAFWNRVPRAPLDFARRKALPLKLLLFLSLVRAVLQADEEITRGDPPPARIYDDVHPASLLNCSNRPAVRHDAHDRAQARRLLPGILKSRISREVVISSPTRSCQASSTPELNTSGEAIPRYRNFIRMSCSSTESGLIRLAMSEAFTLCRSSTTSCAFLSWLQGREQKRRGGGVFARLRVAPGRAPSGRGTVGACERGP
ncbi:MAG: t-SNARE [Olpidium bornovanus]|uniref:t-SNARE n=1 Tax=Olpidium bornovanus TaxID=278681 RepID=A0A8H7ZVA3_9FUNG|nr:MAG: t-SNARE [Olpidium bornovanus]